MTCRDCLSRRQFLSAATAAGLVAVVGCGDGQVSGVDTPILPDLPPPGGGGGGGFQTVFKVSNFPGLQNLGELVEVSAVFVAKRLTDTPTFEAFSRRCTHAGCQVKVVGGASFACDCHGSEFSNTGAVTNGPATDPLEKRPTSYDPATDQLTIT
jgi:nitrite reductase/ring-hydroxylating ferredoxin subunit